jgi:hypothetical protein
MATGSMSDSRPSASALPAGVPDPPREPRRTNRPVRQPSQLPHGGRTIFPQYRLVAYYGTAGTAGLGVLGSAPADQITRRLDAVARQYRSPHRRVQIVYELIAVVADRHPGPDRVFSHFIADSQVRSYLVAAKRHKALLVLDIQPGRSAFLPMVQHFAWALHYPFVGIALDPEWRMNGKQVPGHTIGRVAADEVNEVADYVAALTRERRLPQKVFVVHEFRTSMVTGVRRIRSHAELAMVQHVDGFGTRRQKLATFHTVERHGQFRLGFKLFYRQDLHRFSPREVLRIRPMPDFISYQ